jgi:hypothetical protein
MILHEVLGFNEGGQNPAAALTGFHQISARGLAKLVEFSGDYKVLQDVFGLNVSGEADTVADSDDAAHLFRDDRAHHSEMMPPIGGVFVGVLI